MAVPPLSLAPPASEAIYHYRRLVHPAHDGTSKVSTEVGFAKINLASSGLLVLSSWNLSILGTPSAGA